MLRGPVINSNNVFFLCHYSVQDERSQEVQEKCRQQLWYKHPRYGTDPTRDGYDRGQTEH